MVIALAGNPNSGKTTVFNALTGGNEKVGNWAGVTVEKKQRKLKKTFYREVDAEVIDLPGAYSISPFTSEESVTRDFIKEGNPDVIINVVDATNLSRSLFFTTQLLELGIPMVVILNKSDINDKKRIDIDENLLSKKLGCPVIKTSSVSKKGLKTAVKEAVKITQTFSGNKEYNCDDKTRFEIVNLIVAEVEKREKTIEKTFGDKIDVILTNKWFGIPFFALVMFLVFQISQNWVGAVVADGLTAVLDSFKEWVRDLLTGASDILVALVVDGIIGGAIAVIGFLPLVMIMYFLIAILEDCGYMSRVAVVLDPIFKKVGLSGKSVIPFVISVGCAVPGVMASRTIRNERERRATAMLTPFMPCGAKIPVISLFAGAFFDNAGWVSTLMYFMGIAIIFVGALIIRKITGDNQKSYFIIELPDYKYPNMKNAFESMLSRGWFYIVKAATIILLCNTIVQIMQSFTLSFSVAQNADSSILAAIASPFAYVLIPVVGVLSWELAAATITGFIAKENVVGTLAVCFAGLENLIDAEELELLSHLGEEVAGIMAITKVAALSYLILNLFTPPCFAAIGAMNSEMKSAKWLWGGIGLQFAVGYTISYFVYTVGTLVFLPQSLNITAAIFGFVFVAIMISIVLYLMFKKKKPYEVK